MPDNTLQTDKGFTIIEAMIAIAVFSIGILAIMSLQISAAKTNKTSELRSMAVTVASEELEKLISGETSYVDIAPFDPDAQWMLVERYDTYDTDFEVKVGYRSLIPENGENGDSIGKNVKAVARWEDFRGKHEIVLHSIVANL